MDRVTGYLEVGHTLLGEVAINGGKAAIDDKGDWHIVFSPEQARAFAAKVEAAAKRAEEVRS